MLAEDEQRRAGHPEIDIEHVFLALLGVGGPVTEALAERGVTLDTARKAFERLHAQRVAALGILTTDAGARRIPDGVARGGFVYRDGVRRMLEEAAGEKAQDVALFARLIDEPSGHIRELLREFAVDADALDFTEPGSDAETVPRALDHRHFVPASPDAVWALISDPARWLEWNDFTDERAEHGSDGVVRAFARQKTLDGRPSKVKPQFRMSEYRVTAIEPPRMIEWERAYPQAKGSGAHVLRFTLAQQGSGTELVVSFIPRDRGRRKGVVYWLTRPIAKIVHAPIMRMHLRSRADNISRALRR